MKLNLIPKSNFKKEDIKNLRKIISIAEGILKKNKMAIPKKIYFYNSFEKFIKKVLPEVKKYGFNKRISEEIIKCALNNGTYGTLNFKEDTIIEMNFNPFKKGFYSPIEFLALIVHESLHLHLYKKLKTDINLLKFKFDGYEFIGEEKILVIDEGYATFMTSKLLDRLKSKEIKKITIPRISKEGPKYKEKLNKFDIKRFDKLFENLVVMDQNKGFNIFNKKFKNKTNNEEILNFAKEELKNCIRKQKIHKIDSRHVNRAIYKSIF